MAVGHNPIGRSTAGFYLHTKIDIQEFEGPVVQGARTRQNRRRAPIGVIGHSIIRGPAIIQFSPCRCTERRFRNVGLQSRFR
jgi:hypothetical protein